MTSKLSARELFKKAQEGIRASGKKYSEKEIEEQLRFVRELTLNKSKKKH